MQRRCGFPSGDVAPAWQRAVVSYASSVCHAQVVGGLELVPVGVEELTPSRPSGLVGHITVCTACRSMQLPTCNVLRALHLTMPSSNADPGPLQLEPVSGSTLHTSHCSYQIKKKPPRTGQEFNTAHLYPIQLPRRKPHPCYSQTTHRKTGTGRTCTPQFILLARCLGHGTL